MDRTVLGKTNLEVSVLGLGGGGYSKLGVSQGKTEAESIRLVRQAVEMGINLIDTAAGYGTERLVGAALEGIDRDSLVLCSKGGIWNRTPDEFEQLIDKSLVDLRTDHIDLYQVHGLSVDDYALALEQFLPVLEEARVKGKIRFIGVTERFEHDTRHNMLSMALGDSVWHSVMVGCNILNFCACKHIFPSTLRQGIGVLGMFAVRYALTNQTCLAAQLRALREEGGIDLEDRELENPLGFLLDECKTLPEAAYRFCRHTAGIDVVLSGTGSVEHLEANVRAANLPPLSDSAIERIETLLGSVDSISGKSPDSPW